MSDSREITICPGSASFKELIDFIFEIQDYHKEILPIRLADLNSYNSSEEYSEFLLREFPQTLLKQSSEFQLTKYVPREEVYEAIGQYAKPKVATRLRRELNQSFPQSVFGNQLPLEEALNKISRARVL